VDVVEGGRVACVVGVAVLLVEAGGEVTIVPGPTVPVPAVPPAASEVDDSGVVDAPVPGLEPGLDAVV